MSNDKNAFKAGLFILIALALGVTIFVMIRGAGTFFRPMRTVTVAFDIGENLGGLKIGDTVRIGGFDQGRVVAIKFADRDIAPTFFVDFTLPSTYDLRDDAVVQIEQGLTGTANLNITSLGSGKEWAPGTRLDGKPSPLAEFYAIAPEARGLVADVRSKVAPGYAKYEQTLDSAGKAVGTFDQAMAQVRDVIGDTKTDIRGTMANLNGASGTLKERLPKTIDRVDTFLDTTTKTIEGAKGTLEDIRVAASNTKEVTAEARSLLTRNRSRFDKIIESLRDTSTNLESASAEIRRSPWRLLYTPKPNELANLNLYDSARQFAEAANALNDAAAAVRDAAKDPTTTKEQLDTLLTGLNASFEHYKEVEAVLWKAVK